MKKFKVLLLTLFVVTAIASVSHIVVQKSNKISSVKNMPEIVVNPLSDYDILWAKVDSLGRLGLTRSALDVIDVIYNKAKNENNAPHFVKAVIHKLKFESYITEDEYVKCIFDLDEELKTAKHPVKPLLHSILAEIYWRYYQQNRTKFLNRTETSDFIPEDIRTWDLKKIVWKVIENYRLSLENADSSKAVSLHYMDEILNTQSDSKKYRPTLYDFLAHRAVDFFMNQEPGLARPADKFELDNDIFIRKYNLFVSENVFTDDVYSLKYYAILVFQDMIRFHQYDSDPQALIDADLKRLSFVRKYAAFDNVDSLYLKTLTEMEKQFISHPSSTEIAYEIANFWYEAGLKYKPSASDDNKWYLLKAYNICENAVKRFPNSIGANNCKYLQAKISTKNISFKCEEAVSANKPYLVNFTYKNVKEVYVRLIKVDPQWDRKMSRKHYGEKLVKQYIKQSPAISFNVTLPIDPDYQTHTTEIQMPKMPAGYYIILISDNAEFNYNGGSVAYNSCWITNLSYLKRNVDDNTVEFIVLDRNTGKPVANADAQLYKEKYNYTLRDYEYIKSKSYKSDENGIITITSPEDYRYNYYYLELKTPDYEIHTDAFYVYSYYSNKNYKVYKTVIYTDRAIYRPGQTIYFKGIMMETDGENPKILPGTSTLVSFYDANNQKVSEMNLTTNEYGTFSGTFTAPQNALTGQMYIKNEYGYVYFSVEEYKRPKFEVKFNPVEESYKLNETVTVKGNAKAYAGSVVDNADVKYRVIRTAVFPYWWYCWWGYYPDSPQLEIINGTTKTNENGEFTVQFTAIPDKTVNPRSQPIYSYVVYADVTDLNGETRSSQTTIRAAKTALDISVSIPAEIEQSEPGKYNIITENLNGKQQHVKGTIQVYKLKGPDRVLRERLWEKPDKYLIQKNEYIKTFPYDEYGDENQIAGYEKTKSVFFLNFNTGKDSVLELGNISSWETGNYVLEMKAKDKYGEEVVSYHYFVLYKTDSDKCPLNTFDWFTVLKGSGEPGEKASFLLGTKDTATVLYEIEHRGKIISREWLTLNNTQSRIDVDIKPEYRGNFCVHFTFVRHGRFYKHDHVVIVPYSNKELNITYETFRNKLLPGQNEEWKIKITGKNGEKVAAEMLAAMYDASLDAYRANNWLFNIYTTYYSSCSWASTSNFSTSVSSRYEINWNPYAYYWNHYYDQLNWFGFTNYYGYYSYYGYGYGWDDYYEGDYDYEENGIMGGAKVNRACSKSGAFQMADEMVVSEDKSIDATTLKNKEDNSGEANIPSQQASSVEGIATRKNFNETAFFYPHLATDENGSIVISFTMPEALTRWKFMALAHTKDLMYAYSEKEIVTQKDLMILSNPPRFLREGDKLTFAAKISNISADTVDGTAVLLLFDALTMQPVDAQMKNTVSTVPFKAFAGQSTVVSWDIYVPEGIQAVVYKVYAKTENFSDGEEMMLPVLTNRILVTETMPIPVRGKQNKDFNFTKLINSKNSQTITHQKLTLEFTSNPAWYAIQALPYLMEYPYECAEQVFSRFYANSIASHIANSHPRIKEVFDSWKNETPDALLSNLEKNQDLKNALLEETPWVMDAKNESQRKRNVAVLFDLNRMSNELEAALIKLEKMQCPNGGWPWFKGMPDDRYITQHIITGMGHLDKLGVKEVKKDNKAWKAIKKGVYYLDDRIREDYEWILKYYPEHLDDNNIDGIQIQYLYARSYFIDRLDVENKNQKAFDYFKGQARKYWLQNNRYLQGMIALALNRLDDTDTPQKILNSLKENAIHNDEMGMYWKDMDYGYYWYQAPIETQALLIEAFDEVGNDYQVVEELKVWLLKQKQVQDWKTTKATVEACYSLLLRGTDWLANEPDIQIYVGGQEVDPKKLPDVKAEAGTGYFRTSWLGADVHSEMGKVKVLKRDDGVAWGALYWQYFENIDLITPAETPLKLNKKLFVERYTSAGPVIEPVISGANLKVGDKIKVRIELRVDRDMEYVHMKDMRASGFEPVNVISRYKYQDGLGYYEATGDAATNFFFAKLPKGTYVFEYPLRVQHKGDFSNGITTIQCMYAPEFTSHSEGIRVKVI